MRQQRMTTIAALGMALALLPPGAYAQSGAAAGGLPSAAVLPILEEGAGLSGRSKLTLDLQPGGD